MSYPVRLRLCAGTPSNVSWTFGLPSMVKFQLCKAENLPVNCWNTRPRERRGRGACCAVCVFDATTATHDFQEPPYRTWRLLPLANSRINSGAQKYTRQSNVVKFMSQ